MNPDTEERSDETPSSDPEIQTRRARVALGANDAVELARTRGADIMARMPGTLRATRTGARRTTSALQRLPDSTLGWLTAVSVGLAAGLKLAGAPRLVAAAGAAPAVLMGAAIALRPDEPAVDIHEHADESAGGTIDMTDEHTKGAISTTKGKGGDKA